MIRTLVTLAAALAFGITPALAAPKPAPSPIATPGGTAFTVGVWTVHTTSADMNFHSGDFSAPNKLVMTRVGGDISADRANGNYKSKTVTLYGHVVMHDVNGSFNGVASVPSSGSSNGPATLTADTVNIKGKIYTATGHVHYVQNDTTVDADKGTLNDDTHNLYLEGNVHIVQGSHSMEAAHVKYNTISGNAHAEGNVTMQFPSAIHESIATPRPIHIPNPLEKKRKPAPAATASP
ncbi:MAG: LptA/OstA family protein [Vulcanimicrobiaceae bacterium]